MNPFLQEQDSIEANKMMSVRSRLGLCVPSTCDVNEVQILTQKGMFVIIHMH